VTPQSSATSLACARVELKLQQKLISASPLRFSVASRRRISSVSPLAESAITTSPAISTPRSPCTASAGCRNSAGRASGAERGGNLLRNDAALAHAGHHHAAGYAARHSPHRSGLQRRQTVLPSARPCARPGLPAPRPRSNTANTSPNGGAPQFISPLKGKPAPTFTLEDLSGKKVSLASYKGKAVLINFWATWCGPCKIETPWLVELRNQYAAQGFEILGVSTDDLDRDDVKLFANEKKDIVKSAQQLGIDYPVLIDGATLSKPYDGLDEMPTSYFVDRKGTVVAVQLGLTSKADIEGNIKKALGQ
jgi:thiol-disulfide isomerase/thioredoxin